MFVKPATRPATDDDGNLIPDAPEVPLVVRFPPGPTRSARRSLKPEGEEVGESLHWHRLLLAGDVVLVEPPATEPEAIEPEHEPTIETTVQEISP